MKPLAEYRKHLAETRTTIHIVDIGGAYQLVEDGSVHASFSYGLSNISRLCAKAKADGFLEGYKYATNTPGRS